MKKILSGLIIAAGLATGFMGCNTATELKFNPPAGSKYRLVMTTDQDIDQEMMGQKMQVKSISEYAFLYEINKADGDNKELKMTFEKMKSTQRANGKEMIMDSDVIDTANPASKIMGAVKGSSFDMTINGKGEVKSIKGMDLMMQKMINAAGDSLPSEAKAKMAEGIKEMMNDDMLKSLTEQSFKIFPDKKVKVGDTWTSKIETKSFVDMVTETTYSLKKIDNGVASLDIKSVITPGANEKVIQGTKVETNLTGTQTGTMELEVATGMTLSSNLVQKIDCKMKANGMEIPIKINGVTTVKTTKL
ncbi:MAG: DUF6263 family protein [Chitinophagaceae bacterium]